MKVLIADNVHLVRTKDGEYYSPSIYSYDFFKRYLNVFDKVKCMGKTKYVNDIDTGNYLKVSGSGIEIVELPWYQGMKAMFCLLPKLIKIYRHAADDCDCCIYRIAQVESFLLYMFTKRKVPFCVEVVNDPESFVDMPSYARKFSVYMTRKMTWKADGASYVTEHFLQNKYPSKAACGSTRNFETYYSSIDLDEEDICKTPIEFDGGEFTIVHVANAINSDIKGHTTLINAFSQINKEVPKTKLLIIGDGTKLDDYKMLVLNLGLTEKVTFTGRIKDKKELFSRLRQCNLMIMPTKMEGLPRTIIEAMSMGLPCLSSPTAGIPEILDDRYLFPTDDAEAFAKKTLDLITSPDELRQMSVDNIEKAKEYCKTIIEKRRTEFYVRLCKLAGKK